MARRGSWTWTVVICLLIGVAGASIYWLYGPYGQEQLGPQVVEDLKAQRLSGEPKGASPTAGKLVSQAMGQRFQLVTNDKQVFLVDMKNGRVWRYFHQTKEQGFSQEDEGFLPVGMYYGGKKHYSGAEIEAPPSAPGNPGSPPPGEK